MNNTINIWDDPDYPWGEDLSRDLYKIEYDERKKREQGAERAGLRLPSTHVSSEELFAFFEKMHGPKINDNDQFLLDKDKNDTLNSNGEKEQKIRAVAKATGIVDEKSRVTTVKGGRNLSYSINNTNPVHTAPIFLSISSYPLNADGSRMTAVTAPSTEETLNLWLSEEHTGSHSGGEASDRYEHNVRVTPNTNATAASFYLIVTLETSE